MNNFKFVMISAGFEHGGNVTHRHLDGHSELFVYPFESQLGNKYFCDFLSSVERVQYRYPEFPEGLKAEEYYELIIDEELKTFLRKRNGSKFKDVNLIMSENDRKKYFSEILNEKNLCRRNVIEAFFKATFMAWKNYYMPYDENKCFVGYSPAIGIDAERIIRDFQDVKIIHIIRNPFSAYRDTKRRPFPQNINQYMITWNLYHSTVAMYEKLYPKNVKIFRYEDLVNDKEMFMTDLSSFLNIKFEKTMLYPSWNGQQIEHNIAPWGTVLKSTKDYNENIINELTDEERQHIAYATKALATYFGYVEMPFLKGYYAK